MDIKKAFGIDKDGANNGKWFDMPEGARVKVAKLGNPRFVAEVQRLQKPHITLLRSNLDTSDLVNEITIKAMARTIVLDWEGFELDGEEFPYSVENAENLLENFQPFKEFVSKISADDASYPLVDLAKK
jgi:hypothetical protein